MNAVAQNTYLVIDSYDFMAHPSISISIELDRCKRPYAFIVAWSDWRTNLCGIDGPFYIYPALRKALRRAGALDILGRMKKSAFAVR